MIKLKMYGHFININLLDCDVNNIDTFSFVTRELWAM